MTVYCVQQMIHVRRLVYVVGLLWYVWVLELYTCVHRVCLRVTPRLVSVLQTAEPMDLSVTILIRVRLTINVWMEGAMGRLSHALS